MQSRFSVGYPTKGQHVDGVSQRDWLKVDAEDQFGREVNHRQGERQIKAREQPIALDCPQHQPQDERDREIKEMRQGQIGAGIEVECDASRPIPNF
jgi:hypothetical protein